MPAIAVPLIAAGISALAGWFGNRKQTQTTTPTMSPEYGPLQQMLIANITKRMSSPYSLPSGYEAGQIRGINNTYGLAAQNLANRMTARGLGSSPVAAAGDTRMQLGRAGQISTMQANLPILEREMQNQDLGLAQSIVGMGRGTETTTPSNRLGGAFTSAADMLAYLYGKGAFGGAGETPLKGKPLPVSYLPLPSAPAGNYRGGR